MVRDPISGRTVGEGIVPRKHRETEGIPGFPPSPPRVSASAGALQPAEEIGRTLGRERDSTGLAARGETGTARKGVRTCGSPKPRGMVPGITKRAGEGETDGNVSKESLCGLRTSEALPVPNEIHGASLEETENVWKNGRRGRD